MRSLPDLAQRLFLLLGVRDVTVDHLGDEWQPIERLPLRCRLAVHDPRLLC